MYKKWAVRFVFTWRTKVPDATTGRNCLISLIHSFFDALWTTAQYVQGCQQDHLWCRHYKTVRCWHWIFYKWMSYKYFCCVRIKKKPTCSSPFVEGNKFLKFSVYKFDVWCTKHGIYFFSVFCNSHRRVTYSCCKKLS